MGTKSKKYAIVVERAKSNYAAYVGGLLAAPFIGSGVFIGMLYVATVASRWRRLFWSIGGLSCLRPL
jgi:hypothetical protein